MTARLPGSSSWPSPSRAAAKTNRSRTPGEKSSASKKGDEADESNDSKSDPLKLDNDGKGADARYQVTVDPCFELMSIVFYLAHTPGFDGAKGPYPKDVETYFAPYVDHDVVKTARALTKSVGISYNAPADLACHLDEKLKPVVKLQPPPQALDARWGKVADLDGFLADLRDFAETANVEKFFSMHEGFYKKVASPFQKFSDEPPVVDWYESTIGKKKGGKYFITPTALMTPHNNGTRDESDDASTSAR